VDDGLGRRALGEGADGNEEENAAVPIARAQLRDEETRPSQILLADPRRGVADRRPADRAAEPGRRAAGSPHARGFTQQRSTQRVRTSSLASMRPRHRHPSIDVLAPTSTAPERDLRVIAKALIL